MRHLQNVRSGQGQGTTCSARVLPGQLRAPAEKGKKSSPPSSWPKPLYRTISSPPAKPGTGTGRQERGGGRGR